MAVELQYKIGWVTNAGGVSCSNPPINSAEVVHVHNGAYGSEYDNLAYNSAIMNAENNYTYDMCLLFDSPTTVRYYYGGGESDHDDYQAWYDDISGKYYYCRGGYAGYSLQWTQLSGIVPYFETINDFCTYVGTPQAPAYQWHSVPSISGKNGILSLSTINDSAINNGNPVTGATSDTFYSTEDSKVEELVTYATPIDSSKLESFTCIYQATLPFTALKLLVKKNSAPQDEEDADLVVNLPNPALSTGIDEYTATNLDPLTDYFCVVQVSDNEGHYKYSDPAEVRTGFMDRNFDYTGAIQTFTAPKTGIYQLETWGAQGGDATDGTNTARGGYGAYAYGEMLLQQGETIYINVGGQNGYGGGGVMPYINPDYILESANSQIAEVVFEGYNIHRVFYKTNSGFSCALMLYIDNYVGCVLLSNESASSVYYKAIDDGSVEYTNNAYFTINYRGQVWYMSKTGLFAVNAYGTWDYPVLHISAVDYPSMTSGVYDEAEITQFLDLAFEVLGQ